MLLAGVALSVVSACYALEKRAQKQREAGYQSALRSYSEVLKPGMTRKDVEGYFRSKNIEFRQMCCVDRNSFSKGVYDDLVKIGQEGAPWFCREKNVYIAFQFTGHERHDMTLQVDTSDTLKDITIFRWLEVCL